VARRSSAKVGSSGAAAAALGGVAGSRSQQLLASAAEARTNMLPGRPLLAMSEAPISLPTFKQATEISTRHNGLGSLDGLVVGVGVGVDGVGSRPFTSLQGLGRGGLLNRLVILSTLIALITRN